MLAIFGESNTIDRHWISFIISKRLTWWYDLLAIKGVAVLCYHWRRGIHAITDNYEIWAVRTTARTV